MPPRRARLRRFTPLRAISTRRRRQARIQAVVKLAVLERDGYRCRLADLAATDARLANDLGIPGSVVVPACWGVLEAHHLGKQSQQGEDTLDNEVTLCTGHNGWVEDHPTEARLLGLVERVPLRKVANVFPRVAP